MQDAARSVELLRALHGGSPRVLGEDFAGGAALSRAWIDAVDGARAIAVDLDRAALARADGSRVETHVLDVRDPRVASLGPCDVVHAGNFSLGELATHDELEQWCHAAHARLAPGGVVVCDVYGGESAWRRGALQRKRVLDDGAILHWTFEQREVDPLACRVVNTLSFRVVRTGEVVIDLADAFVYRWRLWSVPELRRALEHAGFRHAEVRTAIDADGRPGNVVGCGSNLATGFVAVVSARSGGVAR